ncbi:MAG TPA: dihydroorotase [Ferruginibacter sp.]|jgi:dihydroorotase|nr:dihydroorotase [Ferruginibacter sp.]
MKLLIKQAQVIAPSSPLNGKKQDILIENGKITRIADSVTGQADQVISEEGICVSPGWMDIFADFADPGQEYRETIETGARAAAAGGFTDVMLIPNTSPVTDTKAQADYLVQKGKQTPVNIHPIAAITRKTEGKDLAEMYDMHQAGAIAFGDGIHPVQSAGLLLKALQYVKTIDGTVIQLPDDSSIGANGLMNEGIVSTRMGLPGKPIVAEELMVARDIKLARYTESRLHFTGISSPKSLEYIKRGKEGGIQISCSITPYQAFFCDEDLAGYNTHLKLNPPLRTRNDMLAIRQALLDGSVDCIASHHLPQHWDGKACEFEYARYGMISLETMFAVVTTIGLDPQTFVQMQAVNARRLFGLPVPEIAEGADACLTIFAPAAAFTPDEKNIRSKSKNSPFTGMPLKGKVIGIVNKAQVHLN